MKTSVSRANIAFYTGGLIIMAAVALALASCSPKPVTQAETVPPRAVQLGTWIDEKSAQYDDAVARIQKAEQDKKDAEVAAHGYRMALCNEFKMRRIPGQLVTLKDENCADFQ